MYHNKVTQATQDIPKPKSTTQVHNKQEAKVLFKLNLVLAFLSLSLCQQHNKQEAKVPFQIQPSLGFSSLSLSTTQQEAKVLFQIQPKVSINFFLSLFKLQLLIWNLKKENKIFYFY